MTEAVPDDRWFLALRRFFRRSGPLNLAYRTGVALVGTAVIVIGVVLLPLPGPGWLIIFAGLAILATEFAWAGRMLRFARHQVGRWAEWVKRQGWVVRGLLALATLLVVAAAGWWYVSRFGVPDWLPLVG